MKNKTNTGNNNMNTVDTKSVEQLFVLSIEESMHHIKFSSDKTQINGVSNREYAKVNHLLLVSNQRSKIIYQKR
jgi:hypothetical protein